MHCPNCGAKIRKGNSHCLKCGTRVEDLKYASFKEAVKAKKEYQPELVVFSPVFPPDLSYKTTLIYCIFFGWMGMHCYYVHRFLKAILLSVFSALFFLFGFPVALFLKTGDVGPFNEIVAFLLRTGFYVFPCALGAFAFVVWIWDIIKLAFKNFNVPVVLIKKEEREQKGFENLQNKTNKGGKK